MRISDWSSDVCSSDLEDAKKRLRADRPDFLHDGSNRGAEKASRFAGSASSSREPKSRVLSPIVAFSKASCKNGRSEEHTSELQSLMRISYAVFCLKKKNQPIKYTINLNRTTHTNNETIKATTQE